MSTQKNEYPEWVEKYRGKGRTIRKLKNGYALYRCTSEYRKGQNPKLVQEYLGKITKEEGFIPKKTSDDRIFMEYGLSHMIWESARRDITRRLSSKDYDEAKIAVILYIFGAADIEILQKSYLTFGDADALAELYGKFSSSGIERRRLAVERTMKQKIPDEKDRSLLESLLMLCVVEAGNAMHLKPAIPKRAIELMDKYKLKYK